MKITLVILILFTCATSMAQVNLVLNPSLEQYSRCPRLWDEIKFANYWNCLDSSFYAPFGTDTPGVPEYCNVCANDSSVAVGIPSGSAYYHYARTGDGMAEVQMFFNEWGGAGIQLRDYLQGHLSAPLTAGQSYCVTFYVVQEGGSFYNINHIGAYLDDGSIDTTINPGLIQSEYIPQILENKIIFDTLNWTKIQGSFVANGTERLITIGNFSDTADMDFAPVSDTALHHCVCASGIGLSYYLVDDVSVIPSNAVANAGPDRVIDSAGDTVLIGDTLDSYVPTYWYANGVVIDSNKSGIYVHPDTTTTYVLALLLCDTVSYDTVVVRLAGDTVIIDTTDTTKTGVAPSGSPRGGVTVFPNPASSSITITHAAGSRVILLDAVGQEVFDAVITSNKAVENIGSLAPGVYVVEVVDEDTGYKITKKVVKE